MKKKLEIKNILIDETKYENWFIYFIRYDCGKSIDENAEHILSLALDKVKKLIGIETLMVL